MFVVTTNPLLLHAVQTPLADPAIQFGSLDLKHMNRTGTGLSPALVDDIPPQLAGLIIAGLLLPTYPTSHPVQVLK